MRDEDFLAELEERLEENRKLMQGSFLPESLKGPASYLGFHTFTVLLGISFLVTVMLYGVWFEELMSLSRILFLFI